MWRQELWHPMVVHFAVGLLVFGAVVYLLQFIRSGSMWGERCRFAARPALVAGVVAAWGSIFTGEKADSVVGRTLCDPLVLESHERSSYLLAWLVTAAVLADLGAAVVVRGRAAAWVRGVVAAALLGGAGLVGYVGHLGAKLVYQQAAAVHHPSEDCREFEP